ncbi:hypothetical protein BGZ91_008208 [Linnemannia elongata]|nr:hypothetical protein BGZ91_008208 [Linnemannia elongata]
MKVTLILAAVITASSVSAYQCPDTASVNSSCRQISVSPLVCNNPNVNKDACNAKQCNQAYIDNYSACQCRRSPNMFYEHSANVEGLLRRCGLSTLSNPYGSPNQYRPGQGTQIFGPITSATSTAGSGVVTRVYNGTTYYGGSNTVISGTTRWAGATVIYNGTRINGATTWISGTPSIIRGTSTRTAPVPRTTVRSQHTTVYNTHSTYENQNRGPTRTVVTEKIEPVVVKSGTHQTYNNNNIPANNSTTYNTTTQSVPANQGYNNTSTTYNTGSNVVHPSSTYNTTTTTGYNTANNGYNSASNTYNNGYNTANDVRNNARGSH